MLHFNRNRSSNTMLVRGGILVAILAIFSQISLPLPFTPVPITLQTLACFFIAGFLPPIVSLLTIASYLLLGAVGVPVFAQFSSGMASLAGPTGGFLLGFLPATLFLSFMLSRKQKSQMMLWTGLLGFQLILYFCGCIWFAVITGSSMAHGFLICVVPFLFGDVAKAVSFALLFPAIQSRLSKA